MTSASTRLYTPHRFPGEIISHAVWVWAAGLSLIDLPPAEPELHPAERGGEALRRAVHREVDGTIEDTMAAVDRARTSGTGSHVRIRRLVGCAGIGDP